MYARRKDTDMIGDVNYLTSGEVRGTIHKNGRKFRWLTGRSNIELIESGSFNRKNPNYQPGGKVVRVV